MRLATLGLSEAQPDGTTGWLRVAFRRAAAPDRSAIGSAVG
jgi:hypothetical protein